MPPCLIIVAFKVTVDETLWQIYHQAEGVVGVDTCFEGLALLAAARTETDGEVQIGEVIEVAVFRINVFRHLSDNGCCFVMACVE